MHRFLGIFFCLVFLQNANLAPSLLKKPWNEYHPTPTNKLKTLQQPIMDPSNNLTLAQKESMQASCRKVHQKCQYAEECCSLQCMKRYNRCIHLWT